MGRVKLYEQRARCLLRKWGGMASEEDPSAGSTPWNQIAQEHCYPKLMVSRSSLHQSFPTCYMFKEWQSGAQDR